MSQLQHAEDSVAGAVFVNPDCYELTGLKPEHFHDPKLQKLWEAVGALRTAGKPVDVLLVSDALGEALEACGGLSWLSQLAVACPNTSNVEHYADIVREAWLTRKITLAAARVVEESKQGSSGNYLLDLMSNEVSQILRSTDRNTNSLLDVIKEQIGVVTNTYKPTGLPTGIDLEHFVPGGIPRDKVSVFFAGPGTFKTTLKNHMITTMASQGYRVLDVSLEDSAELTAHRYLSKITGIPYGRIAGGMLDDNERELLKAVTPEQIATAANILNGDMIAPTMKDILRNAQQFKFNGGLDAVFIDYIQLLEGRGETKQVLDDAVRQAQLAAKRHNFAIIFLSQDNKGQGQQQKRADPRPQLGDMLGSSAMRIGAKLVVGLFRPSEHWEAPKGRYEKLSLQAGGDVVYRKCLEAWVLKNVLGPKNCALTLMVDEPTGKVREIDLEGIF